MKKILSVLFGLVVLASVSLAVPLGQGLGDYFPSTIVVNGTGTVDVAAGKIVNVDENLTVSGTSTINQNVSTTASPTFVNVTSAIWTQTADVASPVYNTFYNAITVEAISGSKSTCWLVIAKINNQQNAGYYAISLLHSNHSGASYSNAITSLAADSITLGVASATTNPCTIQVKETASGGAQNVRVTAIRLTPIG